ncbi:MAG: hypothetical protein HY236_03220 [Acidobacteria bacterium]|nr:hypothetical protein [Acidobacteriota bacterium]
MAAKANHEDARLLLQLYDLRRERRLRRARDFVQQECQFKDHKDFAKKYPEGSKESRYVSMAMGYWDMACTLVAKGLINEELFNATNFEHVGLWFRFKPLIEAWRKEWKYPRLMGSLEAVAGKHPIAASYQRQLAAAARSRRAGRKR